jgi:hypothetical protein
MWLEHSHQATRNVLNNVMLHDATGDAISGPQSRKFTPALKRSASTRWAGVMVVDQFRSAIATIAERVENSAPSGPDGPSAQVILANSNHAAHMLRYSSLDCENTRR